MEPPQAHGQFDGDEPAALVGIVFNLSVTWTLSKANRESLNVEGSFQHILTDLYAFIATSIAGFAIWWTGWYRLDAVAALIVAGLMLKAGIGLVRESGRVFLEAAPAGLHPTTLDAAIRDVPGVLGVEDLESHRDFRRLQLLRDWSYEAEQTIFTGSASTRGSDGVRPSGRVCLAVGGHGLNRR